MRDESEEEIVHATLESIMEGIGEVNQSLGNGGNRNVNDVNDLIEPIEMINDAKIIPQMVANRNLIAKVSIT